MNYIYIHILVKINSVSRPLSTVTDSKALHHLGNTLILAASCYWCTCQGLKERGWGESFSISKNNSATVLLE